ncbi:hypothetical protein CVT26_009738 [Gymnopilus dilepis]|uniref:Uncharacterized protein n=1 Tax=Gymnopilus dilepis TaxID=231916 RepID=A0A409YBD3_9AGAR|nr:hypothetical protein CVT26_009738 [Gymnopilus dilepis]
MEDIDRGIEMRKTGTRMVDRSARANPDQATDGLPSLTDDVHLFSDSYPARTIQPENLGGYHDYDALYWSQTWYLDDEVVFVARLSWESWQWLVERVSPGFWYVYVLYSPSIEC